MPVPLTPQSLAATWSIRAWRALALALAVLVVAGCATQRRAPVEDRTSRPPPAVAPAPAPGTAAADMGPTYVVKRGDTLFQIALDTGLDYRELAAWNNIDNVNLIRVGQVLRLTAPGEPPPVVAGSNGVVTTPLRTAPPVVESRAGAPSAGASPAPAAAAAGSVAQARNTDTLKAQPKAFKEPYSEQALRDAARPPPAPLPVPVQEPVITASASPSLTSPAASGASVAAPSAPASSAPAAAPKADAPPRAAGDDDDDRLDWVWPAKGKIVGTFSETANLKGIDIAGSAGQPVLASAGGTVVYAGTGLRGYGKLIIVKHNRTYLSAYAHNREILVKEGEKVTKGQKIAEMGNTDASEVKLHFEIRRMGKPMDPARYLPPA